MHLTYGGKSERVCIIQRGERNCGGYVLIDEGVRNGRGFEPLFTEEVCTSFTEVKGKRRSLHFIPGGERKGEESAPCSWR